MTDNANRDGADHHLGDRPKQAASAPYYLAGPMSGIPQFNFPLFYSAAATLRAAGYTIISPAELDDAEDKGAAMASPDGSMATITKTWGDFLARDVKIVADQVQGIIFLPGWSKSRGAKLEAFTGLLCGHTFGLYTAGVLPVTWITEAQVKAALLGAST